MPTRGRQRQGQGRRAYPQPIWGPRCVHQPEEGGGEDKAGGRILNQYGVRGAWSQPEEGGGKDKAGGLILNQYWVRGAWSQPEEAGGRRRQGQDRRAYPQPIWVSEVRGLKPKKTEAGTRPERLSSTNMGFRGVESEAEEDRGGDRAGGLILNQHIVPIVQSHVRAPEVEQCQPEEGKRAHWFGWLCRRRANEYPRSRAGHLQKDIRKGAEGGEYIQTHVEVYARSS